MEHKDFESFCGFMHQEHLIEVRRESNYKDYGKPYNEYVLSNLNFLYQAYEKQISKQKRKKLDGLGFTDGVHSM
tara:strand:+ start:618 stop:839 length:222 start_codon:yes stop_codon:yes gene_type:complete